MTYVPVVPSAPPSPRARELGSRLEEVINTFRAENPGLSNLEIRQAMALATKGAGKVNQALVLALAIGLLFIFAILGAVGIFLVVLAAILRNR
jgi:hypothetical protein